MSYTVKLHAAKDIEIEAEDVTCNAENREYLFWNPLDDEDTEYLDLVAVVPQCEVIAILKNQWVCDDCIAKEETNVERIQ